MLTLIHSRGLTFIEGRLYTLNYIIIRLITNLNTICRVWFHNNYRGYNGTKHIFYMLVVDSSLFKFVV